LMENVDDQTTLCMDLSWSKLIKWSWMTMKMQSKC
jgi:hypothetical protein